MFSILSLLFCYGSLFHIFAFAKQCDPANFICSGRCPNVPPDIDLPYGVTICMKDSNTPACVCWTRRETTHALNFFLCDALINGSVTQVLCRTPKHCFPPDSEPTCLVIPYCNCILMNNDKSLKLGNWKPVKAIIKTIDKSENYPPEVREFSLKHLFFLFGFVVVPLLCWCFLNFVSEKKCRYKNMNGPETQPINAERGLIDQNILNTADNEATINSTNNRNSQPVIQSSVHATNTTEACSLNNLNHSLHGASRFIQKSEDLPSYEEVMGDNPTPRNANTPPPAYESLMHGREGDSMHQMWQSSFHTNSSHCDNA